MTPLYGFHRPSAPAPDATVAPLQARDIGRLSLGWSSHYSPRELEQHLLEHPGMSWWVPATGEYLIGGPWRHRAEIAAVQELTARLQPEALVAAFTAGCRERGLDLAIMLDQHETRRESFYRRIGFDLLQEIIIYELPRLPRPIPAPKALRFEPLTPEANDELLAVDHAAFPWLWWNNAAEFAAYGALYGVELFLGREPDGTPVAYVGLTSYRGWGHLDRIAVIPDRQGLGYGLDALNFAAARLAEHGARRIGLSTQADNIRSQHLYERYGFRRFPGSDYTIYGTWLSDDESRRSKVEGRTINGET
jgi:ribosomal protein S18 acetylase RimI-like enzyme